MKFKLGPCSLEPNYNKIPTNIVPMDDEGAATFNQILAEVDELEKNGYTKIVRSRSGGISISKRDFRPPCFDIRVLKSCIELTVLDIDGMARIQFRTGLNKIDESGAISGHQSWIKFVTILGRDYGIDIHKYKIENGEEIKKQIPKAMIGLAKGALYDLPYVNVHHIDLNSSHMAGVAEAVPELRQPIEDLYNRRKGNPIYKAILTHTWGYMQSSMVGYGYAHLSKAGLEYTNRNVQELAANVVSAGGMPILYNTDGFWYCGEIYHGPNEGRLLGQYKNDYVNCKLRVKSNGCYEFMDSYGNYKPVVRGYTRLDAVKDREQWQWGDIYNMDAEPVKYGYNPQINRIINDKGEIL